MKGECELGIIRKIYAILCGPKLGILIFFTHSLLAVKLASTIGIKSDMLDSHFTSRVTCSIHISL